MHNAQPYQFYTFLTFVLLHVRAHCLYPFPSIGAHLDNMMVHKVLGFDLYH